MFSLHILSFAASFIWRNFNDCFLQVDSQTNSHMSALRDIKDNPENPGFSPVMAVKPTSASSLVSSALRRECFVTVGATASFRILFDSVLTSAFVDILADLGYTHLKIQCGPDLWYARYKARILEESKESAWRGIKLALFDFNKLGLGAEMRECKGKDGKSREGVVVCHAGKLSSLRVYKTIACVIHCARK